MGGVTLDPNDIDATKSKKPSLATKLMNSPGAKLVEELNYPTVL